MGVRGVTDALLQCSMCDVIFVPKILVFFEVLDVQLWQPR